MVGVVLLEVERPLVWRCGVSAPAFTSQLSALELRPEWWLPRAGSGPGQVAEEGATGGLLWAAAAQPEGTGGTQDNPWDTCCPLLGQHCSLWVHDADTGTSLFRTNDIDQYRIIVVSV